MTNPAIGAWARRGTMDRSCWRPSPYSGRGRHPLDALVFQPHRLPVGVRTAGSAPAEDPFNVRICRGLRDKLVFQTAADAGAGRAVALARVPPHLSDGRPIRECGITADCGFPGSETVPVLSSWRLIGQRRPFSRAPSVRNRLLSVTMNRLRRRCSARWPRKLSTPYTQGGYFQGRASREGVLDRSR